jgi:hypothetical protein
MAYQSYNMSEHPELKELYLAALKDPDKEVLSNVMHGLHRFMPLEQAIAFFRKRLAEEPTESTYWGVYQSLRDQREEPAARAMLKELTRAPVVRVAELAREALEEERDE